MIWKKKKSLSKANEKFSKDEKVIKKDDAAKLKGGKVRKDHVWNGCGGIIPQ